MQVSAEEMAEAKVPLNLRDYCAHLFIPLMKCRKDNYYLPWKCKKEKHAWEECQFQE
jgi:NADH dehydrogenase (ubiquinone) 1 beta subcomplex subunit 7